MESKNPSDADDDAPSFNQQEQTNTKTRRSSNNIIVDGDVEMGNYNNYSLLPPLPPLPDLPLPSSDGPLMVNYPLFVTTSDSLISTITPTTATASSFGYDHQGVYNNNNNNNNNSHYYPPNDHQSHFNPLMFSSDYACSPMFNLPLMADHPHQGGLVPQAPPSSLMGVSTNFFPNKQIGSCGGSRNNKNNHVENSARGVLGLSVQMPRWDSSVTRAARSKRKMARQLSSSGSNRLLMFSASSSNSSSSSVAASSSNASPSASSSSPSSSSAAEASSPNNNAAAQNDVYHFSASDGKKLRFILEKQLKNSDVNTLGRIVLPKKPAEANLPNLAVKEGIQIAVRDASSARTWHMRYRFWPNNKSRMYVMENTGDYVRLNKLKSGDYVMLYHDDERQLYISCRKAEKEKASSSLPFPDEEMKEEPQDLTALQGSQNVMEESTPEEKTQPVNSTLQEMAVGEGNESNIFHANPPHAQLPTSPFNNMLLQDDIMALDDSIFTGFNDYNFRGTNNNVFDFNDCDISLYVDLMTSVEDWKGNGDNDERGNGGNGAEMPK